MSPRPDTTTTTTTSAATTATARAGNGVLTQVGGGRLMGVGSLPHRDADAAAAFAIGEFDIATVPSLPQRSLAEGLIARAVAGLPGVSLGQYGSFAVDPAHLGDDVPITTDLASDAFVGLRAFLDLASAIGHDGRPVKWQFVGPVTLGVALQRAGLHTREAFLIAARAVRQHVADIGAEIARVLPSSEQIVVLDEPWLVDLMRPDFPIAPDEAVDLISTAMAAASGSVVGVHCCGPADLATMLASGPRVLSIPADDSVADYAGYLARFLEDGGIVAWGAVPTDRPVGPTADRYWRALAELWCSLAERGVDANLLRRQALVTPTCGFAAHQVSVARRLTRLTGEVARKVKDQATAASYALGA